MCGFLGEVTSSLLDYDHFKRLLDFSIHRGPDQQGFWKDDHCQLGFNRLSILDVTAHGMQPLMSPSGTFAMVFNGEIYNYKALQHAHHIAESDLRSTSDSEVLAHLIEKLPIDAFAKTLNGMFSIAIWELETQKLHLIRDFSGIKPLYYGCNEQGLVFASQFDQVFKHPAFKTPVLRPDIMKEFFGLGYMSAPNTVFEGIYQVEPGQYLTWDFKDQSMTKKTYYTWDVAPTRLDSLEATRNAFSECMNKVVEGQLRSDVPLATFLSSGYDSSLITAYAKKHKTDLTAFTFGISDSELDESEDASRYASLLDVGHVVTKSNSKALIETVDAHFKAMPEPFGDYSSVPSFLITKAAKQYATVMLSGDGGDELFWGYPRFRKSLHQAHWFKYPLWLRKLLVPFARKKNRSLSSALSRTKEFPDWILRKQIHFTELDQLMPIIQFSKELYALYQHKASLSKPNVLNYLKKNEFYAHMQRTLRKVDLTSMANSLEVRVPFLDKTMIDFSNTILSEFTITHDRPKLILKDDLYQFIPIEQVAKQKKGFTVPVAEWLRHDLKADFIKTVVETPFYGANHINPAFLNTLVGDFYGTTKKVDPWGLWHLYAWQKWALQNDLI